MSENDNLSDTATEKLVWDRSKIVDKTKSIVMVIFFIPQRYVKNSIVPNKKEKVLINKVHFLLTNN